MSGKHYFFVSCAAIALIGIGYILGSEKQIVPANKAASREIRSVEPASAPEPTPEPKSEPPTEQVQLEVGMVPFSPRGCQNDPAAMGCAPSPSLLSALRIEAIHFSL